MKEYTEEDLARVFKENGHLLEKVTNREIEWIMKNPAEAVCLFFEAAKHRSKKIVHKVPRDILVPWKSIDIGGISIESLYKILDRKYYLGNHLRYFIQNNVFKIQEKEEKINFVVLPLEYLGFDEPVRSDVFLDQDFLSSWSQENLSGQTLSLCKPEDPLFVRTQYDVQSCGETLWVAMSPLVDSEGDHRIFCVRRRNHGRRWLIACPARSGAKWSLGMKFMFRII